MKWKKNSPNSFHAPLNRFVENIKLRTKYISSGKEYCCYIIHIKRNVDKIK